MIIEKRLEIISRVIKLNYLKGVIRKRIA